MQFKEWGVEKNVRGKDMEHMLRVAKRREIDSKETSFASHGVRVPPEKIARFARRRARLDTEVPDGDGDGESSALCASKRSPVSYV